MNKQSSNKLAVWGIVISILALLICLMTIGLWIFEVAPKSIVTSLSIRNPKHFCYFRLRNYTTISLHINNDFL